MAECASPLLTAHGVSVRFGGVTALDEVDLTVDKGRITAVIGPNGAGKTTLLNAISGMTPMGAGRITLDGRNLTGLSPHARARAGVVRTFQNLEIFSNMTVLENVMTGAHSRIKYSPWDALLRTPRLSRAEAEAREQAMRLLHFVGLSHLSQAPAQDLPYGSLRLLELARAAAACPKVVLLDEPAAGLNNRETRELAGIITRLKTELSITVVLVEHDMELVMGVSDRITVISFGRVIATGTPAEIQKSPEVIAAYLGEDDDEVESQCAGLIFDKEPRC